MILDSQPTPSSCVSRKTALLPLSVWDGRGQWFGALGVRVDGTQLQLLLSSDSPTADNPNGSPSSR